MSARYTITLVVVFGLTLLTAAPATAQVWQPGGPVNYVHDFKPFETFDIRNFESGPDPHEGFFFVFDKLNWAFTGERVPIGRQDVVITSTDYYPGAPVAPTQVPNALTDGGPRTDFAWGERYEFGYVVDHHGWLFSVLDGPKPVYAETFGFGPVEDPTDGGAFNPGQDPDGDPPGALDTSGNPLGSVAIVFAAPAGLLTGWADVFDDDFPDGQQGGVMVDEEGFDGDGNVDDVNADLVPGFDVVLGVPVVDFGDLVTFLPTFQSVSVRSDVEFQGVELMKVYRFKPTHRGSVVEFYYGARYLRLRDQFRIDTIGGVIGDSFWDTQFDNNLVGPQVGIKWFKRRGRWTINAQGRFMFAYNVINQEQVGSIGRSLVPGAVNNPLYFNPTSFQHGKRDDDFSPTAEMRVEASYNLTRSVALQLGYTATFIDNLRRAAPAVNYTLPNMGFVDAGTQEIFVSGVNLGVQWNR